jgi:hypothetical protein
MRRLARWSVLLVGLAAGCASAPPRSTAHAHPAAGHTSRDVAYCEAWAKWQTGYDPVSETVTRPAGAYPASKPGYDRAYTACMTARPPAPAPLHVVLAPAAPAAAPYPAALVTTPPPVVVAEPRRGHVPPGPHPVPGHCRSWHPIGDTLPCRQRIAIPGDAFILGWAGDHE